MIQTTIEKDIEVTVVTITTGQEEDPQDVLYVTKLITYVLNFLLRTKLASNFVLNVE